MDRGLYIAASGMLAEQVRQDQIANDLANASTAGYKADRTTQQSFGADAPHQLRHRRHDRLADHGRAASTDTVTDFTPQPLKDTGEPLDFAINGDGFFAVQTAAGHALHAQRRVHRRRQRPADDARRATRSSAATTSRSSSAPTARSTRACSTSSCCNNPEKDGDNLHHRHARAPSPARPPGQVRAGALEGSGADPDAVDGGHDGVDAGLRVRPEGHPDDRRDARQGRVLRRVPAAKAFAPTLPTSRTRCSKDSEPPPPAWPPSSRSWTPSSNDLANANTNGYKRVRVGFSDLHVRAAPAARRCPATRSSAPARAPIQGGRTFEQGGLSETGIPTDVAHRGRGLHQGQALRRPRRADARRRPAHRRQAPPDDRLRRPRLADDHDPRGHSRESSSRSAPDGTVLAAGRNVGKIALVNVRSPQNLAVGRRQRLRHHRRAPATPSPRPRPPLLKQGALEASNTDMAAGHDGHDRGPAHLPADLQGDPDRRPDDGDRQRGQAMSATSTRSPTASLPADVRAAGTAGDQRTTRPRSASSRCSSASWSRRWSRKRVRWPRARTPRPCRTR